MSDAPVLSTHPSAHANTHTPDILSPNTHASHTPSKHTLLSGTPPQDHNNINNNNDNSHAHTPVSLFSPATIAFATLDNLTTPAATMEERTRAFLSELSMLEEELENMMTMHVG